MSDFSRVEDSLRMLKKQEGLTLEDALGVYLDLCQDIKESGQAIDSLHIKNAEKLLTNLSRSGRIFLNIIRKHSEEIRKIDSDGRIQKQESKLAESIGALSEQETQLQAAMTQLEKTIQEEAQKRREYEEQLQKAEDKRRRLAELEQSCQQLSAEVSTLTNVSLESVRQKRQALLEEKEKQEQQLAKQWEELTKQTKEQENSLRQQRAAFDQQAAGRQEELLQQKQELKAHEDELNAQIERLLLERNNQKERFEQAEAEVKAQQLQKEADLKAMLHQKETELAVHEDAVKKLNMEINTTADAIHLRREKKLEMEGTVAVLKEEQNKLNGNVVMLQNEIDRLSEHLRNSDASQLVQERDRLRQEKLRADEQFVQEQTKIDEQMAALRGKKDELQAIRDRFEKEKSSLLDQNAQSESRIDILKEEIARYTDEKSKMENNLNEAEEVYRRLEQWFESLEVQKYSERLQLVEKKIVIFKEVQASLFMETGTLGLAQGMTHQDANDKRKELREQMENLEKLTEDYRKRYNMICRLFSD